MFDWLEDVEDWMLYGPLMEEAEESKQRQKRRDEEEYDDDESLKE